MNWIPVTQSEARSMFSEAIGVFGLRAHSAAITRIVTEETVDIDHQTLIAYSKRILASSLNDNFTITLGYCCYVLPFERYKKLASRYPDDNLDVGEAFGLHIFNNAAALKARYPGTIVYTWKMDPNPKRTWFADVLRNSFAHGQSKIIMVDELGVEISNARDGITPNFAIFMTLPEFRDLIVTALATFITTVVQGGTYEPLSKLLQLNV